MAERCLTIEQAANDAHFRALLRDAHRSAMTWDDFLSYPLPADMSPLEAWELLLSIASCTGVELELYQGSADSPLWYRPTRELVRLVDAIERRAADSSTLHRLLSGRTCDEYLKGLRIAEAVAAAKLDGICFDRSALASYMRTGLPPSEPAERVVVNTIVADADLASYVKRPFDRAILFELCERVLEGASLDGLDGGSVPHAVQIEEDEWMRTLDLLEIVVSYANCTDEEDSVVLRGNLLGDVVRYFGCFGPVSALVGSLASRLYFMQCGLPVLALVPISSVKLSWFEGQALDGEIACSPQEYESTRRRSGGDITVHQTLAAQCIMIALDNVEEHVKAQVHNDVKVRERLLRDGRFNRRQRLVMARAIRSPHASFSIRYHQENHGVSYATARRDLVELEQEGYLVSKRDGKSIIYRAGKCISDLAYSVDEGGVAARPAR